VPGDIAGDALGDEGVLAVSRKIRLVDDPALSARFPAERFARIRVELLDGRVVESGTLPARGDAETPLSEEEITTKFHALADGPLGSRAGRIEELVSAAPGVADTTSLLDALLAPLAS
jgi:2-methylcitrate dehydratase PrpD